MGPSGAPGRDFVAFADAKSIHEKAAGIGSLPLCHACLRSVSLWELAALRALKQQSVPISSSLCVSVDN